MTSKPSEQERIYMGAMVAFGGFIVLLFGPTLIGALMLIAGLVIIGLAMGGNRPTPGSFRGDRDYEDPY
jgi:dipeptide/tripeptide permease